MPPFVLVTGNPGKLAEARRLAGFDFDSVTIDLPEIQSLSYEEIVREKAAEAWRLLGAPLVVEEAGQLLARGAARHLVLVRHDLARIEHVHVDVDVQLVDLRAESVELLPDRGSHVAQILDAELLDA